MKQLVFVFILFVAVISCRQNSVADKQRVAAEAREMNSANGIYHWKTTFSLNDYEKDFLKKNAISRIYIRFFDVALQNESYEDTLSIIPIATTLFKGQVPDGIEVVPTVYITYEALAHLQKESYEARKSYTDRILTRIKSMASYHEIRNIKEVQFDCDWTSNTAGTYCQMCMHAKNVLNREGKRLSITLRLHQMNRSSYSFPEADRGVLMLYNTGSFKNPDSINSILSYNDAEPYIRRHEAPYPVDYAFPTYSWNLLFRNNEFKCIARNIDIKDSILFQKSDYNRFIVQKDTLVSELQLKKGDVIRHEDSDFKEIERVKSDLSRRHNMKNSRHIIYHLDSTNLSKYTDDEIKYILMAY